MKHTLKITIVLVALFLLTQIVGLATVSKYLQVERTAEGIIISHEDTLIGPQPEIKDKSYSAIPIVIFVLIGTALVFALMHFKMGRFWKLWFFTAVFLTLSISFDVYIARLYAVILALALAIIKTFKPNVIVHNLTEIFVYTGITIVILPYLNVVSAITLLVLISIYDMYAVWKSKHMIKLAKFQTKSKVFAGLMVQYSPDKAEKKELKAKKIEVKQKSAILGGGDIAFPLMFSAAVMESLILAGLTKQMAFFQSSIITLFVAIALALLFLKSEKNKFYPAMPFLTAGCLLGYGIVLLIGLF
jgi:presenilin-like A22 family membrane protease